MSYFYEEIVLEAVKQNGLSLEDANQESQNNIEIVLEAVKQNGLALKYASENLQNNIKIVLEAIKQNGLALYFANIEFRNDRDIIEKALNNIFPNIELKINENIIKEKLNLQIIKGLGGEIINIELDNDEYLTTYLLEEKIEKIIKIKSYKQLFILNTNILTEIAMFPGNLLKKYSIQSPIINLMIK